MVKKKEFPHIDYYTPITIELFCMLNIDYIQTSEKYNYKCHFDQDSDNLKWERVLNPQYDPSIPPDPWPDHCKKTLGIDCLKCKHVAYADYKPEDED